MAGLSLVHSVREPLDATRDPAPVLILLHGVGSNEQDLMGLAPALDRRFLVISVRAPITLQHGSYAWYHVQFTGGGHVIDAAEAESSRLRLLRFVDEVIASYNVDEERIFLMGFSQGCIMSLAAGLTEPRRFAGIVGMSGRLLPDILTKAAPHEQLRGLPLLVVHGTFDRVLAIEYGRAIRDAMEKLPVDLTYREYPMDHGISDASFAFIGEWLAGRLEAGRDWREIGAG